MPSGSRVRFLVVSDHPEVEGYLHREFAPCAAGRTLALSTVTLPQALSQGLPSGPWDRLLLAAGAGVSPEDARRLKALAPAAQLFVVEDREIDEARRRDFLAAGAAVVMSRAAAAKSAFHGMRPCSIWRRRQTEFLLRLRSRIKVLRDLEARRRAFLDDIFHELRSPLTVVSASIRMLLDDEERHADPDRLSLTRMAARNSDHMVRRVVSILERSKLESGMLRAERAAFDLEPLAQSAREECRLTVGHPLKIGIRAHRPLPPVFADRVMIEQVLRNLVDNAARFARTRVVIALRRRRAEAAVQVSVFDDGPGLDPVKATRLFERFLQGPRPPGTGYKGMGLGLGICRDLLTLNEGRIWAGTRRGGGGRFHFTVPAAPTAAPLETRPGTVSVGG